MTVGHMIILDRFNKIEQIDSEKMTAKVQAGTTLQQINSELFKCNMALPVLGSISFQTISGAISTATHGTGIEFGCLSSCVVEIELVQANGDLLKLKKGEDEFEAYVCSLGCLGVITSVTIQCSSAFALKAVQEPTTLDHVLNNLDKLVYSNDHWRFWWFPHTKNDKCITHSALRVPIDTKTFVGDSEKVSFFGKIKSFFSDSFLGYYLLEFTLFTSKFIPSLVSFINDTWFNLLFNSRKEVTDVSFKVFNFDCLFKQFVNEWSIPKENTAIALLRLKKMIEDNKLNVHFPIEVRFVKHDDIWLSPCYGRDSCYIGIIMYRPYDFTIPYQKYFDEYCEIMKSLGGRPHWAKEFILNVEKDLPEMYPKWHNFKQLRQRVDPENVFMNDYLSRLNL